MSISREQVRKIAAKSGMKEVSRDDPIYSEPPSVTFITRPGKSTGNSGTTGSTSHTSKQQTLRYPVSEKEDTLREIQRQMANGIVEQASRSGKTGKSLISRPGNPPADTETTNLTPSRKEQQNHPSQEIEVQVSDQITKLVFPEDARFFDVEGIPVVVSGPGSAFAFRYDVFPPERYSSAKSFKNGAEVSREEFLKLIPVVH